jgi:hypothetical protein
MLLQTLCRLLLIAGSGFPLLPCSAQEGENVTLQFLSFPKSLDPKPVELLFGDRNFLEVEIPTNELSKPYKVKRLSTWAVGRSDIDKEGKPAFTVFGQAKALGSAKQLILLIRKGADNSDGMEVIPIDNDIANFGGGKFLFMNAAKVDIAGEAGGVKFAIRPGTHTIIKPKADANGRTFHAMFYFRKDNEASPFFSSKWPISDKVCNLIFFYHDPETKRLRMHTIRNFL